MSPPLRCVNISRRPILSSHHTSSGEMGSSAGISMGLASGRPVIASRIPVFEEFNQEELRVLLNPRCSQVSWPGASFS